MAYSVAIYLEDKVFGGREEGGWWYNAGQPEDDFAEHTKGFLDENAALDYARDLNETLIPTLNVGRPSIGSVLSRGQFRAVVCEGNPKPFPSERPHYE